VVLKNKSFDITVSPVIRIIGDFDKIGDFVLGDLRVAAKYKSVTFLDEFGVTVEVHEVNRPPEVDANFRRYNTFKTVNGIVFFRNIPFLGKGFLAYKKLNSSLPVLEWNALFRWWSNLPMTKVGSIGRHLESIISLKLLEKDMVLLHGSVVSKNGSAILFTGLPNQGKTYTAIELIKKGYEFLSEDICVLSRLGDAFAVPFTTSLKSADSRHQKLTLFEMFRDLKCSPMSKLSMIIILEKSSENLVLHLSIDEAAQKLLSINHLEFYYHINPFLRTYLALHQLPPIHNFMVLEEKIIRDVIMKIPVYLVRFSTHSSRSQIVNQIVERWG